MRAGGFWRKHKVRIIYKSGASIDVRCDQFTIKREPFSNVLTIGWSRARPDPMLLGVDEIVAVWRLR